jgi:hypothetical protein
MICRVGRSSMMALLLAASACGFDASGTGPPVTAPVDGSPPADAAAPAQPVSVRLEAAIDGRSQLRLAGTTVQWLHLEFAAPGRHDGDDLPTLIDGIAWFPTWPDDPDAENRDCACTSEIAELLDPPLPQVASLATLTEVEVRNLAAVVEQPSAANGFTTVVELDDTGEAGSETYVVLVQVAPE